MLVSFLRVTKFALQDFWRNFWLSFVTMTVLILALFSVNVLIALSAVSESVITSIKSKVDINILISSKATAAEISNFETFLKNLPMIKSVQYKNKEQVLEEFKQKNSNNPNIAEALKELEKNPFNDTFIVVAKDTSDYYKIIQDIQTSEYEKILSEDNNFADPQRIIAFVEEVTNKTEKIGLVLTITFAIIAFLIVFNTIRVIIYTHREEISVMRLVGATNWFIRTPYLIESIMFGVISLVIKIGLLYVILYFVQPHLASFLEYYNFSLVDFYNRNFIQIFGMELIAVTLLTMISSAFAIRKYLKV